MCVCVYIHTHYICIYTHIYMFVLLGPFLNEHLAVICGVTHSDQSNGRNNKKRGVRVMTVATVKCTESHPRISIIKWSLQG